MGSVGEAQAKEQEYVHDVYNEIAAHFSETRYKPWPIVTNFLQNRLTGSIGIDIGCGNGKYLGINDNIYIIGSDRSDGLIECAHGINSHYNVMVADGMNLPHRDNTFDFAISIAVVHHWTTRERRVQAIHHILSKIKSGGQALIYCWALEQGESRRGYHEGMEQDVMVPWVLHDTKKKTKSKKSNVDHEKPDLTGIEPKDRATYVAQWRKDRAEQRAAEAAKALKEEEENQTTNTEQVTKYRFYHLYKEGELEEDCIQAGATIVSHGYEKDNWYVIAQKQ
ncbi:similar to Saccharomyces cerevisiae YML014W TRM9 tRNA methyltransferase [Maudiozyma saulgeensis]|uniref:Similar to Saccharomyces cerevisiae YML014W TRM9 tRNA methyltransferase n=1 Tax=Maudiozyma saulgeensis TaxID=1789683 RepID=A0A1X7QX70_9SACH|nr:similar to Saccharomyces cerevisiae YML014W TRM9 tRNA methyltransferase [Kazachstania saulgeensis]